ncbi:hypothetical protein [Gilliamella sp. Pas-s27]|uniref:XAC2610-related protein n=1 Tax=Gilliamella sp. Pas-s27 TaxID=2687311 RepID=UPI0013658201|nr:hypothetical protein [Gilliamella sp. Pas-s27]MWP48072.1 hypothetical protein [Gilliamella sp. Pas-s27]
MKLLFFLSIFFVSKVFANPILLINEKIGLQGLFENKNLILTLDISDKNDITGLYKIGDKDSINMLNGSIINKSIQLESEKIERNKFSSIHLDIRNNLFNGDGEINGKQYPLILKKESISYKKIISSIKIEAINDNDYELVIVVNQNEQRLRFFSLEDKINIIFEDLNFDSYPDIRISENYGDINISYSYFLYDPKTSVYRYSKQLSNNIINPKVLYENKVLIGQSRDGCCFYEKTILYQNNLYKFSFNYLKNKGEMIHYNDKNKVIKKTSITKVMFDNAPLIKMIDNNL